MKFKRNCPNCNVEIVYTGKGAKSNCTRLTKLNKLCKKCSNNEKKIKYIGEDNPFFGKNHTEEFKKTSSKLKKGIRYSIKTEFKKGNYPYNKTNLPKYSLLKLLDQTNESFYWVGFLLADGSFYKNRFEFSLQEKDKKHLELFKNYINGPELKIKGKSNRISFSNKNSIKDFTEFFNIKSRKTYNPPDKNFYEKFCDVKLYSLLCGIIDGDGYIDVKIGHHYNINITSHSSWNEFYLWLFNRLNIKVNIFIKNNISRYTIGKKENIINLFFQFEELKLPKLKRKWVKIEKLLFV